jgi:hypothetical protein
MTCDDLVATLDAKKKARGQVGRPTHLHTTFFVSKSGNNSNEAGTG